MKRYADIERTTRETRIKAAIHLDGAGEYDITTGIPFFDHMLTLFSVHGFFDLTVSAVGDIAVDHHHTVEDVGLVMGDLIGTAMGDRKGIRRYGFAEVPMDDALTAVTIDLSNRPYLVYRLPEGFNNRPEGQTLLYKEFFRALANRSGMNLHINMRYGDNDHHVIESVFKAFARSLDQATGIDERVSRVLSSKGIL
ncbi:MAG: imidazoleglycerol-phosphate dehydratase HisB [Desulfobacteraceae bacterium]|jgi:imidazoleglycerol-phosphate dehydratase|nr:MAG: imidazoleglycerol-phosphate dehydratase HisB [Desulfobacteraceae bacterium]